MYSGLYDGHKVSERTVHSADNARLSEEQMQLIAASRLPDTGALERCSSSPFNTVIIPTGKDDGSVFAYYLTPQDSMDAIPFGGHYRFEIRDGAIVEQRSFSKSCISMSLKGEEGRGKPSALAITHMLDPIPTEIHAFSVFAGRMPIYVMTTQNRKIWVVEVAGSQPRARLVER